MPHPGIHRNEIWAYQSNKRTEFRAVRILDPGRFYEDDIRIALVDNPEDVRIVRRPKLPCRWEHLAGHMTAKGIDPATLIPEPVVDPLQAARAEITRLMVDRSQLRTQRDWILAELSQLDARPIAYSIANAAKMVGYSETVLRQAHAEGELDFRYARTHKAVVLHEDLLSWLRARPTHPAV